jgi:hypothetical protein
MGICIGAIRRFGVLARAEGEAAISAIIAQAYLIIVSPIPVLRSVKLTLFQGAIKH